MTNGIDKKFYLNYLFYHYRYRYTNLFINTGNNTSFIDKDTGTFKKKQFNGTANLGSVDIGNNRTKLYLIPVPLPAF
jgi:hypothetical protein